MDQNLVLQKVNPCFQDDVTALFETIIQNNEEIIWAGNVAQLSKNSTPFPFGYILITSKRIIRIMFDSEYESSSGFLLLLALFLWPLAFFLSSWPKRPYFDIEYLSNSNLYGYRFVDLPDSPLTEREKISRKIVEYSLDHISTVQRQDLVIQQKYGKVRENVNAPVNLELTFFPDKEMSILFYDSQDAKEVYDLLMERLLVGKQAPNVVSTTADLVSQLQKLAELHQSNILSDAEFESAKKRILGS